MPEGVPFAEQVLEVMPADPRELRTSRTDCARTDRANTSPTRRENKHPVDGGEAEAVRRQAELRGLAARGQRIPSTKVKLAALADDWLASKRKLRESTLR